MSTPPEVGPFTERLYAAMEPLAYRDAEDDYPMLTFLETIGLNLTEIEDLVMDKPDGTPGWATIMDPDMAPDKALDWLAQCCGVLILRGQDPSVKRQRIKNTDGFKRGTPAALRGAALATLIGEKTVLFKERFGAGIDHAYRLTVVTRTNETPDPQATLRALMEQKPAGINLYFAVVNGQIYLELRDINSTSYGNAKTKYDNYEELRHNIVD